MGYCVCVCFWWLVLVVSDALNLVMCDCFMVFEGFVQIMLLGLGSMLLVVLIILCLFSSDI